jgi:hypothetical protein
MRCDDLTPNGVAESSRWSSPRRPPDSDREQAIDPNAVAEILTEWTTGKAISGTPPGCRISLCRFPVVSKTRPPATLCHLFEVKKYRFPSVASLFCIAFAIVTSWAYADQKPPQYRVLASDNGRVAIVAPDGKVEWEVPTKAQVHDLQLLPNGNILFPTGAAEIVEMTPAKQIVWKYASQPKPGYTGKIEVHAFQRLDNGLTMIAESGNGRIIEVNRDGKIVHEITLTLENPNAHRDTRMVRVLENGHYLVCHEGDGKIREYDSTGKVVWTYVMELGGRARSPGHGPEGHGNEVYGALRLKNGNTLIAGGNNNRVLEVNPEGKTVWSLDQKELPGITLAWVTTLHVLPNGNIIVGNCHAGPENPQLFEVTREKKVVWTFNDFKTFGDSLASAVILDLPRGTIR